MRYILDNEGYIELIAFGSYIECNDKSCTEYTGIIPEGYESLCEWADNANIQAYYLVDGNLTYDSDKDEELQRKWEEESRNNVPSASEVVKEFEGETVTLTDSEEYKFIDFNIYGVDGLNLAGKNKFNYAKASNISNTFISTYRLFEVDDLKPSTQYTISGYDITGNTTAYIYLWSGNTYNGSAPRHFFSSPSSYNAAKSITFSSNAEGKIYIAMHDSTEATWNEFIQRFANAQIEEGTVATDYEPYASSNSIKIKVTNGIEETYSYYKEQVVVFPFSEGQTLTAGQYLSRNGLHNANGTITSYTEEQQTAWSAIENLHTYSNTTKIFCTNAVSPVFKGKYYTYNKGAKLDIYPVGSIYMSVNNINPSLLFGGTWETWGNGRVPVGVDTSQDEFNTVEKTGGEKTHKLTVNEMPSHSHSYSLYTYIGSGTMWGTLNDGTSGDKNNNTNTTTGSAGGGQAHNNLQPYITCYMWKRTA